MGQRMIYTVGLFALIAIGAFGLNKTARAGYESAPYEVVEKDGAIEIREYPDLVMASTAANIDARGNDGSFMRLFRYISGDNNGRTKIAMTTPVFMKAESEGSQGQMGFVMPAKVAVTGAPTPGSSGVQIQVREGGRFAVIRFSGVMNSTKAKANEKTLREWMKQRGFTAAGAAERAGYDAPFTPGIFRRNEVLIRLQTPKPGSGQQETDLAED